MSNVEMAKSYVRQAVYRLSIAERALEDGNYPFVIRMCQEAVELSLKTMLRLLGVEYSHEHDVGFMFKRLAERLPQWLIDEVDKLVSISRRLTRERGVAMCGNEESGVPPEELYTRLDAERAVEDARYVAEKAPHFNGDFNL